MRDPFDGPPSGVILTPIEITCNRIVRRSSKYRNLKRAAKRQALRLWISRKNRLGGGHEETRRKSGGFKPRERQQQTAWRRQQARYKAGPDQFWASRRNTQGNSGS